MTVITEYRLKCEQCGVVSPVWSFPGYMGDTAQPPYPPGWVDEVVPPSEEHIRKVVTEYKTFPRGFWPMPTSKTYHFCCEAHRAAWLAAQEGKTA